ncbi:MAG TPA: LPS export ABC transporter ATP-binding protein [Thermodesulfobacteriota bacterium]|nr:LPS export ABC transporter ATP-binding protein [Deltaproteobacteria bacterium]HNR12478.1 LPS export ABC transporter ATP-binding protein [Thermodesulfobacteriota bacterium]HNU71202.1 LPS export ABC transporter ATP-binding protein [Thermodesulfobacteriota bacterium]
MELFSEELVKYYGKRKVVNKASLRVCSGEVVGLLGPNGAGKTTTFYMIVGFIKPHKGRVFLEKEDITDQPMYLRARRGISYLPQEPSVFRKLTVEENILAVLETLEMSEEQRHLKLEKLMKDLNIFSLARHKAYSLSGGERRRVEISRALANNPSFLLLDEPFTGIDPIAVSEIQDIIHSLKAQGMGILISDHNYLETLKICDRSYILYRGRVVEEGDSQKIFQSEKAREAYLGTRSLRDSAEKTIARELGTGK